MSAGRTSTPTTSIRALPQSVADAIAAGEVVERPASVVKELCENAVDAGASTLHVVVDGAGTVRIRVVDDGCGILPGELELAVARHATSKIRVAADLEGVGTLGFRGEALASIAAVSDLTISSRRRDEPTGRRLHVRHGETVEEGSWGGPTGTTVDVLDLFSVTPARLRFLRGERAESAAALTVAAEMALVHPGLRVTCVVDGRTRLRTPGGDLPSALRAVLGPEASELLAVADSGDINVGGAISEPRRHRGTRRGLVIVVNGRRVHNRALLAAVAEAYRGLVPAGRYPFGLVSVAVDPVDVDVNVHPTKAEVRFRDERAVFSAVQRACWRALQGASVYQLASYPLPGLVARDAAAPGAAGIGGEAGPAVLGEAPGADRSAAEPRRDEADACGPGATIEALRPLRALGQQAGRWLLATSARGVVIVDPHAAHEKVIYTELVTGWSSGASPRQMLLIPALVECDGPRMHLYTTHAELVADCGFTVEAFGPATLRCSAVPAGAARADPGRLLGDLIDSLGGGGPATEQRHRAAALVACHAAVRFGDELAPDEQQRLLDRLATTPGGLTCPHGRPALALFDDATLRRLFRRPAE